ncbi:MAG: hypothetical protein JST55_16810 [Bacteroidetes bacterium]|nr:hypothetical protein [Bacteroidota bacterium]
MKISKLFFLLLLICGTSQAQISITITQPPPNRFYIEDLWKIKIMNGSTTNKTIYLKGLITEAVKGTVITATTKSFVVAPGINSLTAAQLGSIDVAYNDGKIKDIIKNTGGLPSGKYQVCVSAYEDATNTFLASDCLDRTIENITPPTLIAPMHQSLVDNKIPVFSWVPSTTNNFRNFSYALKIVEIIPGQSAYDAFASNPLFYDKSSIPVNIYQYPVSARDFNNKTSYAWKVEVVENNIVISSSDIYKFTYSDKSDTSYKKMTGRIKGSNEFKNSRFFTNDNSLQFLGAASNPPVKTRLFSGNMKIASQFSNKSGLNQRMPPGYGRLELNPKLTLGAFPFTMNALLSSLPVTNTQNINNVSFNFEQEEFLENVKAQENKSGLERFISNFRRIGVGTTYPEYSDLTVTGVPVTGTNLEFEPGLILLGITGINTQKSVVDDQNNLTALDRNFVAGRIGVGTFESSHFLFTYLNGWENENTSRVNTYAISPAKNYMLGVNGKLSFLENSLNLEAEANGSLFTRDKNAPEIETSAVPDLVKNLFNINISSSFDYSFGVKASYDINQSGTKISGAVKYIGPGYKTFGNPDLVSDRILIDGKIEQSLWNNKISLSAFVRNSKDNLIDWKTSTTQLTSFGFSASVRPEKLPYFSISYSPFKQKNDVANDTLKIDNDIASFSANTGYNFKAGNIYYFTGINFNNQNATSFKGLADYKVNSLYVTENVSFLIPLSFSGTFGYTGSEYLGLSDKIYSYDFSTSYTFFDNFANTLGVSYNTGNTDKRTSLYLQSVFPVFDLVKFDLRAEQSFITLVNDSRNEFIFRANLSKNF